MAREAEMHADQLKALTTNLTKTAHEQAGKAANDYFIVSAQAATKIFQAKVDPLLMQVRSTLEEANQLAPGLKLATRYVERDMARWLVGVATGFLGLLLAATWISLAWARHEVAQLGDEKAQLAAEVKELEANSQSWIEKGGRAPVQRCGPQRRPCVQVRKETAYGDQRDIFVLKGY